MLTVAETDALHAVHCLALVGRSRDGVMGIEVLFQSVREGKRAEGKLIVFLLPNDNE
jgi:hypothetical protein